MTELPRGTVTFLFTDLEASTRLWEEHPQAMGEALAHHDSILREAVEINGGHVVKTTGDGLHAAFATALSATRAAVDAQRNLIAQDWPLPNGLRVRMGLHTGHAEVRAGDYFGTAVNRAARVAAAAHGGQVLVSLATEELVRDEFADDLSLVDLGEHRLRDLARPERLFELRSSEISDEFPPPRSLDSYPTNLPVQPTTFVGRERELVELATALVDTRLVTVTGVGGVGKTRLAVQAAATALPRFRDGAWLVELAQVVDASAIPEVIASTIGAPIGDGAGGGLPVTETILYYLARKRALVVLDNCEHVLSSVAELVDEVIRRCPDVTVLATSREGLGVAGERIVVLGTLGLPRGDASIDEMLQADAVQLFVERAFAARSTFAVTEDTATAILEVCRRLDGIPLAIELAAARVRTLSPAQIAERLDERFRLLTGSPRGTANRHRTLRAAIDWSYDHLSALEQTVLARLAVFMGDFDLEAGEAVAHGDDVALEDVLDLLGQLVDKSLLVAEEADSVMRFKLLETIRQYAEERLADAAEVSAVRDRHARHYLALAEEVEMRERGGVTERFLPEFANLRGALDWFVSCGDTDRALRLVIALLGSIVDAAPNRWFHIALTTPGAEGHPLAPAAMAAAANLGVMLGDDPAAAYLTAQRSLALADDLDGEPKANFLMQVSVVAMRSGHLDEGRRLAQRSVEVALADGDDYNAAIGSIALSAVHRYSGDIDGATLAAQGAEEAARRAGHARLAAQAALMHGFALRERDPARALELFEQGIELARGVSTRATSLAYCLDNAAIIRLRTGDMAGARRDFAEAIDIAEQNGHREQAAILCGKIAIGLIELGSYESAAILLSAAEQMLPAFALYPGAGTDEHSIQTQLQAMLHADTLASFRARGEAMDQTDALQYARASLNSIGP